MSESNFESMPDSMIAGMLMHISSEVHHSHRALIDEARRRLALSHERRWIPVDERLPELGVDVLVLQRSGECEVAWRRGHDGNWSAYSALGEITHWMPLPEPPETLP